MTQNVAAGSDTTSIALTSAVFHIISNREVYLKLKEEIRAVEEAGGVNNPITFDQAQALPYLSMCIKEAMRIHPSTGLPLWRVVQEPGLHRVHSFLQGKLKLTASIKRNRLSRY